TGLQFRRVLVRSGSEPWRSPMPSCSSWVDIGGYTAWSLPSTWWPSSRASAATPPMKVPAIPRMWSFMWESLPLIRPFGAPSPRSRGEGTLADGVGGIDRLDDAVEDLVQRADAVDHGELAVLAVEVDHRRGLLFVDLQALAHGLWGIVGAALLLRAAGDALDQQVLRHLQLDREIHRLPNALQQR